MKRPDLTYWLVAMTVVIITYEVVRVLSGQADVFWSVVACLVWALIGGFQVRAWRRYAKDAEENLEVLDWAQNFFKAVADPKVHIVMVDVERTEEGIVLSRVSAFGAEAEEAEAQEEALAEST